MRGSTRVTLHWVKESARERGREGERECEEGRIGREGGKKGEKDREG
jgi:hypothetical protein